MEHPLSSPPAACDTLVLGVTGSPGVLAMPVYVKLFREMLASRVHVIMSRGAQKFVTPYTFEMCTDQTVFCDPFEHDEHVKVPHIDLARRADLLLIAPATANILGKCAHGICDDLLSTTVVACEAPVVFVPSMNEVMWRSRVVQRNVALLRELGHHVIEPSMGIEIATMEPTFGAIPPFATLMESLREVLSRAPARPPR